MTTEANRKSLRNIIRTIVRLHGKCQNVATEKRLPYVHNAINHRVLLANRIEQVQEGGYVGLHCSSMDCDCVSARWEVILPARLVVVEAYINSIYEDAEGPTSASLARPSECDPGYRVTRDLALEAFENGHPHAVYA